MDATFRLSVRVLDDFLSMNIFSSVLSRIMMIFITASMAVYFAGWYGGYRNEVGVFISVANYYLIIGVFVTILAAFIFFGLGHLYNYLLEQGYGPNRALLIMGALVFMFSRIIALDTAIREQIPTVGEIMHEPLPVRLGPLKLPEPAEER